MCQFVTPSRWRTMSQAALSVFAARSASMLSVLNSNNNLMAPHAVTHHAFGAGRNLQSWRKPSRSGRLSKVRSHSESHRWVPVGLRVLHSSPPRQLRNEGTPHVDDG